MGPCSIPRSRELSGRPPRRGPAPQLVAPRPGGDGDQTPAPGAVRAGFLVEVYGDEVGLIVRVRGDAQGDALGVDLPFGAARPLAPRTAALLGWVDREVAAAYVVD